MEISCQEAAQEVLTKYGKYADDWYKDSNILGISKDIYMPSIGTSVFFAIHHKSSENGDSDTPSLVIELPDQTGSILFGEDKINKFMEEGFSKLNKIDHPEDVDALLNLFGFESYG